MPDSDMLGKYRLVRCIGQGGMAEVWKARAAGPVGFTKTVAIKRILPHLAKQGRAAAAFADEARLTARLVHPNIVQVFDFGLGEDGVMFFAMEYVDGINLRTLLNLLEVRGEKLPHELVAYIGAQVAAGLAYAHTATDETGRPMNIVHRDISPHNIMLSARGEVKVTDFGIAKFADAMARRTDPNVIKGKLSYMSPEQAKQAPMDARTDIFALGLVLYELLTTERFFEANSPVAIYQMVSRHAGMTPTDLAKIPEPFHPAVRRTLEADPEMRIATAEELQDVLEDCVPLKINRVRAQLQELVESCPVQDIEPIESSGSDPSRVTSAPSLSPAPRATGIAQESASAPAPAPQPAAEPAPTVVSAPHPVPIEEPLRKGRRKWLLAALVVLAVAGVGFLAVQMGWVPLDLTGSMTPTTLAGLSDNATPLSTAVAQPPESTPTPEATQNPTPRPRHKRTPRPTPRIRKRTPTPTPEPTVQATPTPVEVTPQVHETPTPSPFNLDDIEEAPPAHLTTGELRIESNVPARVKIDGRFVGTTEKGTLIIQLASGDHEIAFTANGKFVGRLISVNANQVVNVKGDLRRKRVTTK